MTSHVDFAPVEECKHPDWTYGEICVKCGDCGRFEKGGVSNPVRSEVQLISQGYSSSPPLWGYPRERAIYHEGKWWEKTKKFSEAGKLEDAMPHCWHNRELPYVRWWLEGKNY